MKKNVSLITTVTILVAVFAVFVILPGYSNAAPMFAKVNFTNATVTANVLNVREGPGTNYKVVCTLNKGEVVKVFGKIDNWYAIYVPKNNMVGVADSRYLRAAGTPAPALTPKPKTPAATPAPKATPVPKVTPSPKATPSPAVSTPAPIASPAPGAQADVSAEEQKMLELVNKARADAGIGPLQFDAELQKVARIKAKDMVDKNYFSHQSPTYGSPFDMMRQFGITFKTAGENIAGNQTVEGAFNAWMNSPGHRKNILNGNFNYTGIGIVPSPTYGKIFVQMFIGR